MAMCVNGIPLGVGQGVIFHLPGQIPSIINKSSMLIPILGNVQAAHVKIMHIGQFRGDGRTVRTLVFGVNKI